MGILGGMFDPVHVGHIQVALAVYEALQLDQVRLIPCGTPNHRERALCSALQRLDMLDLATRDHPELEVDDRELNRPGTSYTYDTLLSLRDEFGEVDLVFILGADAFAALHNWHRWRDLFQLCHFVVIERPGYLVEVQGELHGFVQHRRITSLERLKSEPSGLVFSMSGLDCPVSSSMVRMRIKNNQPLKGLVDARVEDYLQHHQLYRKADFNGLRGNGNKIDK